MLKVIPKFVLMSKTANFQILITGMPKRPMGFPAQNFVQGQVSASTPGTPGGGATPQLQSNQAMTHPGKISTNDNTRKV